MAYTLPFAQIGKKDLPLVGGKTASLGELTRIGLPVPAGFAVTTEAYKHFIKTNKLQPKINAELKKIDFEKTNTIRKAGDKIRSLVLEAKFPPNLKEEILNAYARYLKGELVAVRSSATSEDSRTASFAGQHDTYLNVREAELLERVKACFASLYTDRAILYRAEKKISHTKTYQSVAIQKMVDTRSAGVLFTLDPVSGDAAVVLIEGVWGLGELLVSGQATPDRYKVNKLTFDILDRIIIKQEVHCTFDPKTGKTICIPLVGGKKPCLADEEIKKLTELAIKIEKHYGFSQDIEWAVDKHLKFPENIFIVQARPETIWMKPVRK